MSDTEHNKYEPMDDEEEIEQSISNLAPNSIKKEQSTSFRARAKKGSNELRHRRQKYCEKWEDDFPWLKPDKVDESLGFCTICEKRLVCKKSHLERHQNSFKHQRISGFDVISSKPDNPFAVFLENDDDKRDSDDYELEHLGSDDFMNIPKPQPKKKVKKVSSTPISMKHETEPCVSRRSAKEPNASLNRLKLLKRIDRDRNELNEYYYARQKEVSSVPTTSLTPPQRDSFDLFFESVSASVKSLPPKLSYEVKSKISQLLSEFELRALCEKEAMENATRDGAPTLTPVLVTPSFEDQSKPLQVTTSIDASTMPHLVYTFQQKNSS